MPTAAALRETNHERKVVTMPHHTRDQVINWLNDALSAEEALIQNLGQQVDDAKEYPQIKKMIEEHIQESKQQADMVRNRIKALGGSPSSVKTAVGKVQGYFQGMGMKPADDRLIKHLIADHAAEHMEMASYTALEEAAKFIGDNETAAMCAQIRQQEVATAKKIEQAIPMVVRDYMAKKERQKAA